MPVALPPVPHCQTPLPALPHDPPILNDVANAVDCNYNLRVSRRQGGPGHVVATKNLNDIARGAIYESAIIAARAGGAVVPPWFAQAVQAAIQDALIPIERKLQELNNMMCGDGHTSEFEEVLFVNGEHPVADHTLPALHNVGDINALTRQEATTYLNGYGIALPHNVLARKKVIRIEIGCIAEM